MAHHDRSELISTLRTWLERDATVERLRTQALTTAHTVLDVVDVATKPEGAQRLIESAIRGILETKKKGT